MEPDLPAPVAHRDDAAVRATGKIPHLSRRAEPGLTRLLWRHGRGCPRHRAARRRACTSGHGNKTWSHVRVSSGAWLLGRYQFKEVLTSFPAHHAAPETSSRGGTFKPP